MISTNSLFPIYVCEGDAIQGRIRCRWQPRRCGHYFVAACGRISLRSVKAMQMPMATDTPTPSLCATPSLGSKVLGLEVFDNRCAELGGADFCRAFHQTFQIVGHAFLEDGFLKSVDNQVSGFLPTEMLKHHHSGENQ